MQKKCFKNSTEEIVTEGENIVDEFGNIHNLNTLIEEAEKGISNCLKKI